MLTRFLLFSQLFLFALTLSAQEIVTPLLYNHDLTSQAKNQKMFNEIFVYEIDTIRIPFKDDFSSDKFKKYNAQPSDANVTTQTEYYLYNDLNTVKLPDTVEFSLTKTFRVIYDTVGNDTTIYISLDSTLITIYDLNSYPFSFVQQYVWPPYYIFDTLFSPPADTGFLVPDLIQDSVYIHFVAATDNALWQDNFAYRNARFPIKPPTVGVATFDGLDENGYPYNFQSQTAYGIADYLTSKPINLGFDIFTNPYVAADSIYLSFYYQQTGRGDQPEGEDSLFLEFWDVAGAQWNRVWSTPGDLGNDEIFYQKNILIDPLYLQNGFKFRFGNYGVLSGSIDHWHVDYVYMNELRTFADTIRDDVAYQYNPNSLLLDYSSVPWQHYKWNPVAYMSDTLTTFQRNNASVGHLVGNNFFEVAYNGSITNSFLHPNNPSINAFTDYTTLWDIGLQPFQFDTLVNDTCAVFDVSFRHQATPDFERNNDTVRFQQIFENYYAYDDGSAEAGYGVQGNNAQVALKFNLQQGDSIRAIQIAFHPSVDNAANELFTLMIWDNDGSGGKPNTVLYQSMNLMTVEYPTERYGFKEYFLDSNFYLPAGEYFIGFKQDTPDYINVGLDRNINKSSKLCYKTPSTGWANSSVNGCVMMRPVFASLCDVIFAGVDEVVEEKINIYPNPAQNLIRFSAPYAVYEISLFDINGKQVLQEIKTEQRIDVEHLDNGFYLINIINIENGINFTEKIIIQH